MKSFVRWTIYAAFYPMIFSICIMWLFFSCFIWFYAWLADDWIGQDAVESFMDFCMSSIIPWSKRV